MFIIRYFGTPEISRHSATGNRPPAPTQTSYLSSFSSVISSPVISRWLRLVNLEICSIESPDSFIFCGSEERKPSHTLLYGKAFVTKLLREKDRVWCEIGIFRGSLQMDSFNSSNIFTRYIIDSCQYNFNSGGKRCSKGRHFKCFFQYFDLGRIHIDFDWSRHTSIIPLSIFLYIAEH